MVDYEFYKIKMRYAGGFGRSFFLGGVENFPGRFPFEFGGASKKILSDPFLRPREMSENRWFVRRIPNQRKTRICVSRTRE